MNRIKRIAVFTSGGDAPGMNAAVRAVVRTALNYNLEVYGINRGYMGMISGEFIKLTSKSVRGIIHRGGTILRTARSEEFRTKEGRKKANDNLVKYKIDAVVVIGGDGSFMGAGIFSQEYNIPFVGIPGTIDNDMFGTDYTIGFDTALNTVTEAIDKIKDTALSHDRTFFIEVMGRDAGFIALKAGIATGAEMVLIPEISGQEEKLKQVLSNPEKKSNIIIVAEGNKMGGAEEVAKKYGKKYKTRGVRVNVLGHMQRGGSPTAFDRYLASRMGVEAVDALMDNLRSIMIGYENHKVVHISFNKTNKNKRGIGEELLRVNEILAK
ncbi:MAG: 6-phosphofructokinase [Chlorobi bacterium]|nr:6-phosphofructokinase [Chlorobiota bacterium]